jgi:hypothetical protein
MLSSSSTKLGIQPSDDFPDVYGVLMDWPIGNNRIATIVGLCDGNASLYSNTTFGIIGGYGHETVRLAASQFVKIANKFFKYSKPASEYPYPAGDRINFYLVTFNGVHVIDADLSMVCKGGDKLSELYGYGQKLLTELRLTMQKKQQ